MEDDWDWNEERRSLIRETRQRLELLRRSGVQHLLIAPLETARQRSIDPPRSESSESPAHPRPKVRSRVVSKPQPQRQVAPPPQPRDIAPPPLPETPARDAVIPAATPVLPPEHPRRPLKPLNVPPPPPAVSPSLFGELEFEFPIIPAGERPAMLAADAQVVATCTKCKQLAETRTQTVYGVGSPRARLMFIGEAPGADEDRTGIPFVGRAGQLLTEMITKGMGIAREDVYIANILKCRPPDNRQPTGAESANCIGYLERQIAVIRPEFICLLGLTAAQSLLETTISMGHLRGKWYRYRGIATLVTYHPAYLLRSPSFKKQAWEDLQMLMKAMGLAIPRRR